MDIKCTWTRKRDGIDIFICVIYDVTSVDDVQHLCFITILRVRNIIATAHD